MQLKNACADFLNGYFSTHERSVKTKTAYHADLAQFQAFTDEINLTDLDGTLIERFAADLRHRRYSPASIRRKIVVLKVFCSYWVRRGLLTQSPFWRVKLSLGRIEQLPRSLTEREMRSLLARSAQCHSEGGENLGRTAGTKESGLRRYRAIRNLALIDILFATGMRVGEASALSIGDFFESEGMFKIKGKGGRDRVAFAVDEKSLQIQKEHLYARKQIETESGALFLNSSRGRLSTQGISNVVAQLRRSAGIERHVTPHMLRHTVATLLLQNGVDIRVVQEFLGHASIATTQRYTHVSKEHLIAVLQKRHPSLNLRVEGGGLQLAK